MGRGSYTGAGFDINDIQRFAIDNGELIHVSHLMAAEALQKFAAERRNLRFAPPEINRETNEQLAEAIADLYDDPDMVDLFQRGEGLPLAVTLVDQAIGMRGDAVLKTVAQDDRGIDDYFRPYLVALGYAPQGSSLLVRDNEDVVHLRLGTTDKETLCGRNITEEKFPETYLPRGSFKEGFRIRCIVCSRESAQLNTLAPTSKAAMESKNFQVLEDDREPREALEETANRWLMSMAVNGLSKEKIQETTLGLLNIGIPDEAARQGWIGVSKTLVKERFIGEYSSIFKKLMGSSDESGVVLSEMAMAFRRYLDISGGPNKSVPWPDEKSLTYEVIGRVDRNQPYELIQQEVIAHLIGIHFPKVISHLRLDTKKSWGNFEAVMKVWKRIPGAQEELVRLPRPRS
jgi:hypothetical protein